MKVTVFVTPKKTVMDPQGAAVEQAMKSLGYCNGKGVRVGKRIEFEVVEEDTAEFRGRLDKICGELLSNPVIEDYSYEVVS